MKQNLKDITNIVDHWLQNQLEQSKEVQVGNRVQVNINVSLLQLENWLIQWKKKYNLNQSVNAAIFSDHILKQVHTTSASSAFQPVYYQLNFLHFLALHYEPGIMLHDCIDQFLEVYKDQLSLSDIVITDTGATRAKTNIRFALHTLRQAGLVESKDLQDKRSLRPSIPGLAVLLNAQFEEHRLRNNVTLYKSTDRLQPSHTKTTMASFSFDPTLHASLKMFSEKTHLYEFLDRLWEGSIKEDENTAFIAIMNQYINFTQAALEITSKGIRFTNDFAKKSKEFQQKLFQQSHDTMEFSDRLMKRYRELMQGK